MSRTAQSSTTQYVATRYGIRQPDRPAIRLGGVVIVEAKQARQKILAQVRFFAYQLIKSKQALAPLWTPHSACGSVPQLYISQGPVSGVLLQHLANDLQASPVALGRTGQDLRPHFVG